VTSAPWDPHFICPVQRRTTVAEDLGDVDERHSVPAHLVCSPDLVRGHLRWPATGAPARTGGRETDLGAFSDGMRSNSARAPKIEKIHYAATGTVSSSRGGRAGRRRGPGTESATTGSHSNLTFSSRSGCRRRHTGRPAQRAICLGQYDRARKRASCLPQYTAPVPTVDLGPPCV
jgi:hypothetical protein